MNNSNDLGMGYLLELEIDQVRFWEIIPGEAQRKIFFAKQQREIFINTPCKSISFSSQPAQYSQCFIYVGTEPKMQNDKDYQTYIEQRNTDCGIVMVIFAVICMIAIVVGG